QRACPGCADRCPMEESNPQGVLLMARNPTPRRPRNAAPATGPQPPSRDIGRPVFAQPHPTADPTTFRVKHPSDTPIYKQIDELNKDHKIQPLPFPAPRGGVEPRLTLQQVLNSSDAVATITEHGQIVFHAGGDCGNTRSPEHQNAVA